MISAMASFLQNRRESVLSQVSLKTRVKTNLSLHLRSEDGLEIRMLKTNEGGRDKYNKFRNWSIGQQTNNPTKVVLLVGPTGAGKTTLINAMVNFVYGVDLADNFRLILIDEQSTHRRSQADSQTDCITVYTLYFMPGMPFQYNLMIIDTPGFGDTRGIYRDREMIKELDSLLKQNNKIDQIDCVGLVTPSSGARLSHTQRYVYDGLSSMFGKDIKDIIYVMATFADAKTPPVLEALKEAAVNYGGFYKFNNSALYAQAAKTESDDYDDEINITKLFWDMGCRSMKRFFQKLGKTTPVTLTLTREVLMLRSQLQITVAYLQDLIHSGMNMLTILNKEMDMCKRHSDDMRGSANHVQVVAVPKVTMTNLRAGEHVSNCIKCSTTCHFPCSKGDDDKVHCSNMYLGTCTKCKCHWAYHKDMGFRYQDTIIKENRINWKLFKHYHDAHHAMLTTEASVRAKQVEICGKANILKNVVTNAQNIFRRLEEIALKANPLSNKEYIDLLIESEKVQKGHNFQSRIEELQNLKEEVAVIEGLRMKCDDLNGVSLFLHFQNHICKN